MSTISDNAKGKNLWHHEKEKPQVRTCRECTKIKPTKEFYLRKPYCIDCTQIVLQKQKGFQLKKAQKQIKTEIKHTEELKGKPCIFCGILTKIHYKDDKKWKYTCINCKEVLETILSRKTKRLESRLKKVTEDYLELKEKLEDYKANIKAIIKASKNA